MPAVLPGESGSPGAGGVQGCWNAPPRVHLWPPASALAPCVSAHPTPGHPHGSVSPCCGPAGMETHIDLLGGESPNAHACGVGLHHAVDLAYVLWGDAQARAHAAHGAVGRRHEGVGPCETEPVRGRLPPPQTVLALRSGLAEGSGQPGPQQAGNGVSWRSARLGTYQSQYRGGLHWHLPRGFFLGCHGAPRT